MRRCCRLQFSRRRPATNSSLLSTSSHGGRRRSRKVIMSRIAMSRALHPSLHICSAALASVAPQQSSLSTRPSFHLTVTTRLSIFFLLLATISNHHNPHPCKDKPGVLCTTAHLAILHVPPKRKEFPIHGHISSTSPLSFIPGPSVTLGRCLRWQIEIRSREQKRREERHVCLFLF